MSRPPNQGGKLFTWNFMGFAVCILSGLFGQAVYQEEIKTMQQLLIEGAEETSDPVQNYAAKLFGNYSLLAP